MATRSTAGGGVFLMLAIIVGTIAGVIEGQAMKGVLIGTGVGVALALLAWLLDRRRR